MLESFAKHGVFDLELAATGDLAVDLHHTVEDVGITLGQAVREALGDASGIRRYGTRILPMAEAKVEVAVDVSNRPYLVYRVPLDHAMIGTFDGRLAEDFLYAFAHNAGLDLHVELRYGRARTTSWRRCSRARARAADRARARSARRGIADGQGRVVSRYRSGVSPPSSSAPRVAVVDYGAGNLRSVSRALARSGLVPDVTSDPAAVREADGVVLPGVGAFRDAVAKLAGSGLDKAVRDGIEAGRPYLGLCLGLQLLFDESDEHGVTPGFGVLAGRVERFPAPGSPGCARARAAHRLERGALRRRSRADATAAAQRPVLLRARLPRVPRDPAIIAGVVDYGGPFAAAVAVDNVFAVQFHPEKSQNSGRAVLDAFHAWLTA
jgi:imidazoleglycerol phosphate synthase glutamine amidotransferase subunit HisH/imidazoleglycerol phosphate dehydratase HisB